MVDSFCFYCSISIATFQAQLQKTRNPNEGVHVPSFKAVQSLFHQNRDPLGEEKKVLFPAEIDEAKVIGKLWGNSVSAPASPALDAFFLGPGWSC